MLWLFCLVTFLNHFGLGLFESPSVIIIGAGPAGIAAATKLLESSINNITILEAENRIGGRINTVHFNKGVVELGAEFCVGQKGNIIYDLVKDYDVFETFDGFFDNGISYSNGSVLDSTLVQNIGELLENYSHIFTENYNTTGKSIGEVFIHKFNVTLLKKYEGNENVLKVLKETLRLAEDYIIGNEGSFSWYDASYRNDYKEYEGSQGLIWKGVGFKTILKRLMKSFPDPSKKLPIDDKIRLNSRVQEIDWNQNNSIHVKTYDGHKYSADYVIFTPSIGVLKHQHQTLFTPQLSPLKQQAIEAIGIGGVIKVFLYFPNQWWKDTDKVFLFLWSDEDINKSTSEFPYGPQKTTASWISQIRVILQNNNDPNVWVAWIVGDLVPEIEKMSVGTLKSGFAYVLNKFLGQRYNLTKIDRILKTNWYSNAHFHGTYSFDRPEFYRQGIPYRLQLAEPVVGPAGVPALLFAGEATNPFHFGTAHGAIETGYREAEWIIKTHKNGNK